MENITFAAGTEIEFETRRYTLAEDTELGKYDSTCSDAKAHPGKAKKTVWVRFYMVDGFLNARIGNNAGRVTVIANS